MIQKMTSLFNDFKIIFFVKLDKFLNVHSKNDIYFVITITFCVFKITQYKVIIIITMFWKVVQNKCKIIVIYL